ncbi:MAG: hypothetical protein HYT85_07830 [candidate division NC10 bacterium]|nr:hypothetical protein [candidate division NC10 bacterium]
MRRATEIQPEGFRDLRMHLLEARGVRCPFFEEVVVAFCRAYPVKKMVPSDRLQANCICTREGFDDCPLFREVMARLEGARTSTEEPGGQGAGGTGSSAP